MARLYEANGYCKKNQEYVLNTDGCKFDKNHWRITKCPDCQYSRSLNSNELKQQKIDNYRISKGAKTWEV
jgi:hypothetical protein